MAPQARQAAPDPLTAPLLELVAPDLVASAAPGVPGTPSAQPPRAEPTWPCTACGTTNQLSAPLCGTCGTPFLAAASSHVTLVLPLIGDLTAMSRGQRIAAAFGAVVLFLVPVALVTTLLSSSSADGTTGTQDGRPAVTETVTP